MRDTHPHFFTKLGALIETVYPDQPVDDLSDQIIEAFWPERSEIRPHPRLPDLTGLWSEQDALLITYGNSMIDGSHKPLDLLYDFLLRYVKDTITDVH
ncbi:MAG: alpha-amylase, partial [Pseudomonadota bacterium]